jgi:glucose-1-phosphate thymidylyltransferase
VGLVPAAGLATRLGALPCSKEILPLRPSTTRPAQRLAVMADCLLNAYRTAGINEAYIIIRKGKWDIPDFYGDGISSGINIAYLMMRHPYGTPFTLDQAFPFIKDKRVALGFPDIQFSPNNIYQRLLAQQEKSHADIVLGLFIPSNPNKFDMVDFSKDGLVNNIIIKPPQTNLKYAWICAVWTPSFSSFMHGYLAKVMAKTKPENNPEIYVGTVMQAALKKNIKITAEIFSNGRAIDVGTPDDLAQVG